MNTIIEIVPFEEEREFYQDFTFLFPEEQEAIRENRLSSVQKQSLAGHILVRRKIMGDYGLSQPPLFMFQPHGKPYFSDYPHFHFNISHTSKLLAVAFSNRPVGVDVEYVRNAKESVAKRFFHEEEYWRLMQQPEERRADYFTTLWVLKEAYVKCTGTGIANQFDKFNIVIKDGQVEVKGGEALVKLTFFKHKTNLFVGLCEQIN